MVTGECSARTSRRQSPSILQESHNQFSLNEKILLSLIVLSPSLQP